MKFKFNTFYHLYNHAISNESLFLCDDNFRYFLDKYFIYAYPIAYTFAYCLMPNHFHLLIKIKAESEVRDAFIKTDSENINISSDKPLDLTIKISKQLSNFFNAYAKAFNKMYSRNGKLFRNSMQIKEVSNTVYLKNLIQYIHLNPVMHNFVQFAEEWPYSSFNTYMDNYRKNADENEINTLFLNQDDYMKFHRQTIDKNLLFELEY